jgi:hypothetical protein
VRTRPTPPLGRALEVLSDLVGAQRAFWLGAVRLGSDADPLGGWRIRGLRRMNEPRPEDDQVYKLSRSRLDAGTTDAVTLAQVREAARSGRGSSASSRRPASSAARTATCSTAPATSATRSTS